MTAKEIFTEVMGASRNYFTPVLVAYFRIKDGAIELSKGKQNHGRSDFSFEGKYGVTVVEHRDRSDKSGMFDSYEEAMEFINSLKPDQTQFYRRYNAYGDKKLITKQL